jgi:hypothetical protein
MRRRINRIVGRVAPIGLAILLAAPPLPQAQQPAPAAPAAPPAQQAAPAQPAAAAQPGDADAQPFKPEELEAIVAPIALYPDPLVAQVLMAATYPLEVIQAARLMKTKPDLKGDALNEELKKYEWDDSVKSLCSFPQTLDVLNEKIDWMQKLGDAFLDQRKETMDAIQRMRAKAQAQGNLQSNEQQKVIVEAAAAQPAAPGQPAPPAEQTVIKIEPASPQVVYVPQYNPSVVYGPPPPAYPPYYYPYPPGYAFGTAAISFGVGMAVGAAVWGGCNWGGGDVDIDVNKNNNFTNNVNKGDRATQIKNERNTRQNQGGKQSFNHDPSHRGGAQYRDKGTQQKYNRAGGSGAGSRDSYRGRGDQGGAGRAGGPSAGTRDAGGGSRGGAGGPSAGTRDAGGGQRGGGSPSAGTRDAGGGQRGGGGGGGAFQGGSGGEARASSQRGQSSVGASRSSGYSGGGGASRASGGGGGGGGSRGGGGGGGGGGSRGGGRR